MQPLTKIVCPHCHAILKSSKPLRPGKQVSCLKCRAPFSVSPSDLVAVGSAQEILVSASLAEDAGQVELALEAADDAFGTGMERQTEIPVGVLERPVPVVNIAPASAPYLPPPVAKSAVPIAAPFLPPPAPNRGAAAAAFAALLVLLGCGAFLAWYCWQRNSDAEEQIAYNPNLPAPAGIGAGKGEPPNQEEVTPSSKENVPNIGPKTKPAKIEEPEKQEAEPKKTIKKRVKPPPQV